MTESHSRKLTGIDPNSLKINFSEGVQGAFGDLAAALHFSETCSDDTLTTIRDLSQGKPISVFDMILSFPLMAEDVFEHIHKTGDQKAAKAWHEIGSEVLERGFTLENKRETAR